MRRFLLSAAIVLAAGAFLVLAGGAKNSSSAAGTYKIDLDNAFGLVSGADFKIAGVPAGTIQSISLPNGCVKGDTYDCYAQVTVQVTQNGFGPFRTDAFCQSRPQSLIGEYFIECQPGQNGKVIPPGGTIPVTHTQSTIPADLLQDVMQLPYRERFTLIVNELGAAVAGRSDDLEAALARAVPALTETDNLLNLLGNDSHTLQQLTANSDSVITALAQNKGNVQRFITQANNAASDTATQQSNLEATFNKLPAFLGQLQPAMKKLGQAADANTPVLANLNNASGLLDRLFTDLPGFSKSSLPAIKSLGQASITGRQAAVAAGPTIADLNQFAKPTPELAQNLAIVLHDLDNRKRAVEPDSRSPGGRGFTGLEALLQYVFNQTLAINGFGQFGHFLAVDAFADPMCSQYATPQSVANNLAAFGKTARDCYSWLGPNQPGINETDPSAPSACVPDPGGAPPGEPGPKATACRLKASPLPAAEVSKRAAKAQSKSGTPRTTSSPATSSPGGGGGGGGVSGAVAGILQGASSSASSSAGGNQAQQLLNYLLSP